MIEANPILFFTSEIFPFSKSGGLGDVMGILPRTLSDLGLPVSVITPFYGRLNTGEYQIRLVYENCPVGYPWPDITADIYLADYHGLPVYFIDRPEYFDRKQFYCTYHGDYFDNCERFIFFSRAGLAWARRMDTPPRIVHVHDWHSSLVPAFLHFLRASDPYWQATSTILTIHNLAFQGQYSARLFWESGLPPEAWHMDGAEYHGSFNMLKTGIGYADRITTVSPSYAEEIVTPKFGSGLEGLLSKRADRLRGILNGVDYNIWNPETDRYLPYHYSAEDLSGKDKCKEFLINSMGLSPRLLDRPILGFIGRLRDQKGIDLLMDIVPQLMEADLGLVILGEGALETETLIGNLVEQYPRRLAACIGYTEEMSHQIMAGTDVFLMPSRYEPCGLTQLYSLRYGTLPVTSAVGGLKDTVISHPSPNCTGFTFGTISSWALLRAVQKALRIWESRPELWKQMQRRAMNHDFSWHRSAMRYAELYAELGLPWKPGQLEQLETDPDQTGSEALKAAGRG